MRLAKNTRMQKLALKGWLILLLACLMAQAAQAADSQCFGKVSQGYLKDGVKLPVSGTNFSAYSDLAASLGRTYVHSKVAEILRLSYLSLQSSAPGKQFVYGETGWASGGRFRPHRTHQNGLSVDFFVPVMNAKGQSVPLPTNLSNKLGYNIEFDDAARYDEFQIDFAALAEHLYQLRIAAKAQSVAIAQVIFERSYLPRLFATPRGPAIQDLPFMKGKPWVRHDEHYHVDFSVACKPL